MTQAQWMLYGASGYTGELIARRAVERGHRPLLAGRRLEAIQPLASALGLECVALGLENVAALARGLAGMSLVVHCAGPFADTSAPMIDACLRAGSSYIDITGELPVFEATLRRDAEARARGVLLMSGVGFDVVPGDCLARYVADRVKGASVLELALMSDMRPSSGTAKSALQTLLGGCFERRAGELVAIPFASKLRRVRLIDGELQGVAFPFGDLITAYHTTGIPDINTYLAMPGWQAQLLKRTGPLGLRIVGSPVLRGAAMHAASRARGADAEGRRRGRSQFWARAACGDSFAEAWLETPEPYDLTAAIAVRGVERILAERPIGASTPGRTFGADFVLEADRVRRLDRLPV